MFKDKKNGNYDGTLWDPTGKMFYADRDVSVSEVGSEPV